MKDSQCTRCGSSSSWEPCWNCDGDGLEEKDFGDGIVEHLDLVTCEICRGSGGFATCLADGDWCRTHPLPGREGVARGAVETFVYADRKGETE